MYKSPDKCVVVAQNWALLKAGQDENKSLSVEVTRELWMKVSKQQEKINVGLQGRGTLQRTDTKTCLITYLGATETINLEGRHRDKKSGTVT